MPGAARVGDSITGSYSEHSGHLVPHSGTLSGEISSGSSKMFINGKPAATVGSSTDEIDACCGGGTGMISSGSSKLFVQGKPIARVGDTISPHTGTGSISGGSPNFITV